MPIAAVHAANATAPIRYMPNSSLLWPINQLGEVLVPTPRRDRRRPATGDRRAASADLGSPARLAVLEYNPDGDVVGRLFPATGELVDAGRNQPIGGLRRKQDVIDADAMILLPCPRLVVPERVDARTWLAGTHGVGEAEIDEAAKGCPRLRLKQGILAPGVRVFGVA